MCNAQTRTLPSTFFAKHNSVEIQNTLTRESKLKERSKSCNDHHNDINYCWSVDASVKGVEKVAPLAVPYWLTAPPPSLPFSACNQLTAPPSQIDTFQTTPPEPASNPTFMPIGNNLLVSDRLRPQRNFCPQNQVDLILELHNCFFLSLFSFSFRTKWIWF